MLGPGHNHRRNKIYKMGRMINVQGAPLQRSRALWLGNVPCLSCVVTVMILLPEKRKGSKNGFS
jgi:hypothetical protein